MRAVWTTVLFGVLSMGPQAQPQAASIEGTVVVRGSGAPIGRAYVELRPAGGTAVPDDRPPGVAFVVPLPGQAGGTPAVGPGSTVVLSGADGSFALRNVPPGTYRLYATRGNGFVPGEHGQRTPTGAGTPLTVASGDRVTGVTLVMTPTAAIEGRVTDETGGPSGYAHVQALKAVYEDGRRSLTVMQLVQADDRGMYRLFWLPPGEYYVCAKPLDLRRSSEMMHIPPPSRFGTYSQQMRPTVTAVNTSRLLDDGSLVEGQYVPVCFPGTRDERRSSPIRLRAGETVAGVDVSVAESLVRTFRVRGIVVNGATGAPVAAGLQIIPRDPPAILLIPTGRSNEDGTFDLWGALPGPDYIVASGGGVSGLLAVDVGGSDVNGVTLTVWPGVTVPGRVHAAVRGATDADPDAAAATVTLRRWPPVNGLPDVQRSASASAGDGSFAVTGVQPGDYAVTVAGLPEGTYVESIRLGARDVLREGLHVDGPVKGQLDIVLGGPAGVVEGRVLTLQRQPAAGATVVAIPDAGMRGDPDRARVAVSDDQGRFELTGLAPGRYDVLAWEDVEPGAWLVADAILDDLAFGRPLYVSGGGRMTVDVTMIPAER